MKAAILVENKKPLVVTEVEMPKKLEFGQVLVKIFYSGLCGSQVSEIDGLWGEDKNIPHLLGTRDLESFWILVLALKLFQKGTI